MNRSISFSLRSRSRCSLSLGDSMSSASEAGDSRISLTACGPTSSLATTATAWSN